MSFLNPQVHLFKFTQKERILSTIRGGSYRLRGFRPSIDLDHQISVWLRKSHFLDVSKVLPLKIDIDVDDDLKSVFLSMFFFIHPCG